LISVKHEVNTWINILVTDLGKRRKISAPFSRIIAEEVVDFAWQFVRSNDFRVRVRADKFNLRRCFRFRPGLGIRSLVQNEKRAIAGERHRVTLAVCEELYARVRLAFISLEAERKPAVFRSKSSLLLSGG